MLQLLCFVCTQLRKSVRLNHVRITYADNRMYLDQTSTGKKTNRARMTYEQC